MGVRKEGRSLPSTLSRGFSGQDHGLERVEGILAFGILLHRDPRKTRWKSGSQKEAVRSASSVISKPPPPLTQYEGSTHQWQKPVAIGFLQAPSNSLVGDALVR